jgi:hypothetical protein
MASPSWTIAPPTTQTNRGTKPTGMSADSMLSLLLFLYYICCPELFAKLEDDYKL